jgi:antitoxin component HigA of HigAB toxin-antitoxin module
MSRNAEVMSLDAAIAEHDHLVDTYNEIALDSREAEIVLIRIAAIEDAILRSERPSGLVVVRAMNEAAHQPQPEYLP